MILYLNFYQELCKRNRGVSLLCCVDNYNIHEKIKSTRLFKYMVDVNDELSAFNFIE